MAESRISRIGSGSAEATTVTIPAGHQAGDLLLMFAFRDGDTTVATTPTGWFTRNSSGANSCSYNLAWRIAASSSETSGTWTNATGLMIHVYRGCEAPTPTAAANSGTSNTGSSTSIDYNTTVGGSGNGQWRSPYQWFVAFAAHRSVDTTTLNTPPTGFTNVINALGATQDMVSFDTNGPTEVGWAANSVACGGTASGWFNVIFPLHPAMFRLNNYHSARSVSAGVISVGEKIR